MFLPDIQAQEWVLVCQEHYFKVVQVKEMREDCQWRIGGGGVSRSQSAGSPHTVCGGGKEKDEEERCHFPPPVTQANKTSPFVLYCLCSPEGSVLSLKVQ